MSNQSKMNLSYSNTISVDKKKWFAHVFIRISLEKLFTEPDVEAVVVLAFQLIALATQAVHGRAEELKN